MTAGELSDVLAALPRQSDVCVYADWQGEVERPLIAVDERVYVCGYFAVRGVAVEEGQAIVLAGERLPC